MQATVPGPQNALKYEIEVLDNCTLNFRVPYAAGSRVVVFVIPEPVDSFEDLTAAVLGDFGFWDNAFDDEDWNNA